MLILKKGFNYPSEDDDALVMFEDVDAFESTI